MKPEEQAAREYAHMMYPPPYGEQYRTAAVNDYLAGVKWARENVQTRAEALREDRRECDE